MNVLTLKIPDEMDAALQAASRLRGVSKSALVREFLRSLLAWADVAAMQRSDALQALVWAMPDVEDALQAAAAVVCGAQVIVTRNVRDFKGSPVPAMTPEDFLARHGPRRPPRARRRSRHVPEVKSSSSGPATWPMP